MSRQQILWALVAIVIVLAIVIFTIRELSSERSSTPGQPSPHAIDQSQ
jgi:hypothetical protein